MDEVEKQKKRLFCDSRILLKLKEKFYKIVIKLDMLYGTKCWVVMKQCIRKISIFEMRWLKWISGNRGFEMKKSTKR